ncbi:MAG: rod shape-determining protein MreC [Xanthomonadales bacterium]|nr:rod shape-determining protein MreC [Xanthomonadales bacterium]
MAVAGDKNTLFASGQADTLRLIAYLTAAVALMVTDHHSHYLDRARASLGGLATPLYRVAQAPVEASRWLWAAASERVELKRENDALRGELLLARARLNAARIESEQNLRLRELLETGRRYRLSGRMVEVFQVDLDPSRQRVLLDGGSASGVRVGQPVIDSWGLVGQVVSTTASTASIMLLTDPEHAVPVRNARTGQRAVAYGSGRDDRIVLPTLPMNSDLQVGDELLTSGLGGRFPAGFPVAVVREVGVDENGIFARAVAEPFARLRLSSELLLLEEVALPEDGENWPLEEPEPPSGPATGAPPGDRP